MPTYDYACPECDARWEAARGMDEAGAPAPCPVCGAAGARVWTMPKLFFKADPRDVRPVWHNHDGYSHQHAPRRGRHRLPSEEH
ncbi:MAG TPA: zinc ribbon domain-containing protein [Thermomicrobiales bacterium]|nr:zinc ribbon domain-containing protein [Thermomicrobiales bacterium]